jgi:homoserine dehydrogenase
MDIILNGFGTVGQGLARILRDKADDLARRHGFSARIVAVATRTRGTLVSTHGLDPAALLAAMDQGGLAFYSEAPGLIRDWEPERIVREVGADALVEVTPTDLTTGGPALALCYAAFESNKHVVLANKGPVAVAYADLHERAAAAGKRLLYEGTVMAGTPSIRLAQTALAGCEISALRGILNGTTNYILTQMETGLPYADALAQAQRLGYAEADPRGDVEGWDTAGKALILSAVFFGRAHTLDSVAVTGITAITPADVQAAQTVGARWKLIATIDAAGIQVRPEQLPLSDPLANVSGANNALTYRTDLLREVTLIGPGAGAVETGYALLADLMALR